MASFTLAMLPRMLLQQQVPWRHLAGGMDLFQEVFLSGDTFVKSKSPSSQELILSFMNPICQRCEVPGLLLQCGAQRLRKGGVAIQDSIKGFQGCEEDLGCSGGWERQMNWWFFEDFGISFYIADSSCTITTVPIATLEDRAALGAYV